MILTRSNIRVCRRRTFAPVFAIVMLPLVGCATQANDSNMSRYRQTDADAAFDVGANRPPTPATLYSMARIFAAQGRDPQCEMVLSRIIREHPRYMPAYCDLAELKLRNHNIDGAIQTLSAGLSVSPQQAILANNLGMCWILKGDYDKALRMFTQAAGVNPNDARFSANMAASLGLLGRYDEALSLYEQVIPIPDAQHNLAVISEARRDDARAEKERASAGETRSPDANDTGASNGDGP